MPFFLHCRFYLYWPTLIFLILITTISLFEIDLWLADALFQWQGGQWLFRDAFFTETLIHQGGRQLVGAVILAWIALIAASYCRPDWKTYRWGLWYVLVAAVVAGVMINVLKAVTWMDCPWDLEQFGGDKTFYGLLAFNRNDQLPGNCFPAGHASAAYAWFGLFFFVRHYFPAKQWLALGLVIAAGLVFGVAQQLRGAHLLSHDIWTAWLCWVSATVLYFLFRKA